MKKKAVIIGIIVITAIAGTIFSGFLNAVPTQTYQVRRDRLAVLIELRGKVELHGQQKIYSKQQGVISEVIAHEADEVNPGGRLALLDTTQLELQLDMTREAYNAAAAQYEGLKAGTRTEQTKQAELGVEQARIANEAAQKEYEYREGKLENIRRLYDERVVSLEDVKDVEALAAAAKSSLLGARKSLELSVSNLDMLKKGSAEKALEAARANMKQAQLAVQVMEDNLLKAAISAVSKGIVLAKHIEKGQMVQPGMLLYELGDYKSAYMRVDVLSDDAVNIRIGQKAEISGDALGDGVIAGEVSYIAPRAESRMSSLGLEQQRVEVRISFDNGEMMLRPGFGFDVKIITQEREGTLFVPEKSIIDIAGSKSVFVVKNGKLELRTVETGIENDDYTEVVRGIDEGEEVVSEPDNKLKPGIRVKRTD